MQSNDDRVRKPVLDSTGRRGNAKNKDHWKLLSVSTVKDKKQKIKDFQTMIIFNFRHAILLAFPATTTKKKNRICHCFRGIRFYLNEALENCHGLDNQHFDC